jgi:hypothetical protein
MIDKYFYKREKVANLLFDLVKYLLTALGATLLFTDKEIYRNYPNNCSSRTIGLCYGYLYYSKKGGLTDGRFFDNYGYRCHHGHRRRNLF